MAYSATWYFGGIRNFNDHVSDVSCFHRLRHYHMTDIFLLTGVARVATTLYTDVFGSINLSKDDQKHWYQKSRCRALWKDNWRHSYNISTFGIMVPRSCFEKETLGDVRQWRSKRMRYCALKQCPQIPHKFCTLFSDLYSLQDHFILFQEATRLKVEFYN